MKLRQVVEPIMQYKLWVYSNQGQSLCADWSTWTVFAGECNQVRIKDIIFSDILFSFDVNGITTTGKLYIF